jgi:uncharacterized protein (DUF1330 family)
MGSRGAVGERVLTLSLMSFASRGIALFPTRDPCVIQSSATNGEELVMNTKFKMALAVVAGAALGAAAVDGLYAQAKPKAYAVTETEVIDAAAQAVYTPVVRPVLAAAGARPISRPGGRVVAIEGAAAPKRVGIQEWDSLEKAQEFYNSKAWKDLAPQRDKAIKTVRRYIVEAGE